MEKIRKAIVNSGKHAGCLVEVLQHENKRYTSGRLFSSIRIIKSPDDDIRRIGNIVNLYSSRLDLLNENGVMEPNAAFARSKDIKPMR